MTLLVALEGKDGIALATDSRATYGDPRGLTAQNDTVTKLFKVGDKCAILLSGSGEIGNQIIETVSKRAVAEKKTQVTALMELFRTLALKMYGEWFKDMDQAKKPNISVIIAGYDEPSQPRIYTSANGLNFAPQLTGTGFALTGIPQYALYIINRLYARDKSCDELMHLAVYAITETATQDGKVGGPVQALGLKPKSSLQLLTTEEIDKILTENLARSDRLKTSFFS